jgi:serine/threonine protein kinase
MNSLGASIQNDEINRLDRAVRLFEEEWSLHDSAELERFWLERGEAVSTSVENSLELLAELIKADLRCRFARGQTPTVSGYLERFPRLRDADTRVLSLIYEEFCLNEEAGRAPDVDSFCDRYPDWKSSLASQLQYHRLISKAAGLNPAPPRFPEAGENFEEFHLQSLLGTGGTSRVFLARDSSLGGKQVVLKVSLDRGQEPKAQGPLDHPHIVPVNSVTFQPDRQLRGLSMPYRLGLPLDEVIRRLGTGARPRKAIEIWRALVVGTRDSLAPELRETLGAPGVFENLHRKPSGHGWKGFPVNGSFVEGVGWIVMVIARALEHAHGKATFHRDVKPANVLLTLQEGPQLFDFNLADSPHSAHQAQAALHGGTLPYMAPEQISAFLDPSLWQTVGGPADIYSLGLVFRELITGEMPPVPPEQLAPQRALRHMLDCRSQQRPSTRMVNRAVPQGVDAIIDKCLAFRPTDRYANAASLATDLECFLRRQELVTAVNPSRSERLGNWAIRRRGILTATAATLCLGAAVLHHPIRQALRPPIETHPAFRSAVHSLESGQARRSVEQLVGLESQYPESGLLHLYLAFASAQGLEPSEDDEYEPVFASDNSLNIAESHFRIAFSRAELKDRFLSWAREHEQVVTYLENFAAAELGRALGQVDTDFDVIDHNRKKLMSRQTPYFELARDALRLAVEIDPKSPRVLRDLAQTDDFFGDHEAAARRVSASLAISRAVPNPYWDTPSIDNVLECCRISSWIGIHWAQALRQAQSTESAAAARKHIEAAKDDLDSYDRGLWNSSAPTPLKIFRQRQLLELKVEIRLIGGEVETDLGHFELADQEFQDARTAIENFVRDPTTANLPDALASVMKKRLSDGISRLNICRSRGGVPVASSTMQ